MKAKKKTKSHAKHKTSALPPGMQRTRVVSKSRVPKETESNAFTAMETGAPDEDILPGSKRPETMEGEGERQNDQLAELQQIEPNPDDPAAMDEPSGLSGIPTSSEQK